MKWGLLFTVLNALNLSTGALAADRMEADAAKARVVEAIEGAKVKLDGFIADHVTSLRMRYGALRDQRDPCGQFAGLPGIDRVSGFSVQIEVYLVLLKRMITGRQSSAEDFLDLGNSYYGIGDYSKAITEYEKAENALTSTATYYNLLRSENQNMVGGIIPNMDAALTFVENWLQARLLQCPRDVRPLALDVMSSVVESQTVDDNSSSDGVMSIEP